MIEVLNNFQKKVSRFKRRLFLKNLINYAFFLNVAKNRQELLSLVSKKNTPLFVVDPNLIFLRYQSLSKSLERYFPQFEIAYSFKTNYQVAQLNILKKLNVLAEVVSTPEYLLAKKMGYHRKQIILNGPYKTDQSLLTSFKEASIVNIDTFAQIEQVKRLAKKYKKSIKVGIRVHGLEKHKQVSRFGFSLAKGEAQRAIKMLLQLKNIHISGFHQHIGTNVMDPEIYTEASYQLGCFIRSLQPKVLSHLSYLDVGGGYPSHGLPPFSNFPQPTLEIETYVHAIAAGFKKSQLEVDNMTIITEPGRFLVDDATIWITKILDCEVMSHDEVKKQMIVVDGTVTMLPLKYYHPLIVKGFSNTLLALEKADQSSVVYGASCREEDVLYEGNLPKLKVGEYLIFYCVGAYNQSMGSNFIFGEPASAHLSLK